MAFCPSSWQCIRMRNLLMIALLSASVANAADQPVSPSEFEAIVLGKTFAYSNGGAAYGAEEYFENRRVRWSFLDGDCQDGEWYVSGNQICFIYEVIESPQCWQFYLRNGRLVDLPWNGRY